MKLPAHIVLIGSTYYFRMKTPKDLEACIGKKYLKHSLGTGRLTYAKRKAYNYTSHYHEQFEELRGMGVGEVNKPVISETRRLEEARDWLDSITERDGLPIVEKINNFELEYLGGEWGVRNATKDDYDIAVKECERRNDKGIKPSESAQQQSVQPQQNRRGRYYSGMLLKDANEWFEDKMKSDSKSQATIEKYVKVVTEFMEFNGNCDIGIIDRRSLDLFRSHLSKRREITNPKTGEKDVIEPLSTATLRNKYSALATFFDYLISVDFYNGANPARGHIKYSKNEKRARSRKFGKRAFTPEEISKIFNPAEYRKIYSPSEYFVPILALYTGARANELCQLSVNDIYQQDGYWCIHINDEEAENSVKTEESIRKIPLHPNVVELGFIKWVELVKKEKAFAGKNNRIFPHLRYTKNRFSGRQVKAFCRLLEDRGIWAGDSRTGLHSFRDTIIKRMIDHKIAIDRRKHFVGHTKEDKIDLSKDSHMEDYGKLTPERILAEDIFPILDFDIDIAALRLSSFKPSLLYCKKDMEIASNGELNWFDDWQIEMGFKSTKRVGRK